MRKGVQYRVEEDKEAEEEERRRASKECNAYNVSYQTSHHNADNVFNHGKTLILPSHPNQKRTRLTQWV